MKTELREICKDMFATKALLNCAQSYAVEVGNDVLDTVLLRILLEMQDLTVRLETEIAREERGGN